MTDAPDPVLYATDGPIARVTLNRPQAVNAMDPGLRAGLRDAMARIHRDESLRVVILSGAGRGFCSGTDLTEKPDGPASMLIEREYRPLLAAIASSPKIWIAQVHGTAAGIGAALAMNCDLMTMADSATLYLAFARIGLVPDGGNMWLLHRGMGYKRALQAILEGRRIPAAEAVDLGLANSRAADDALADHTTALATGIAAGAPLAVVAAKRLLRQMDGLSYEGAIAQEAAEQARLADSNDAQEAIAAFLAKRPPRFSAS